MIKPRALTSLSIVFPCFNEALNVSAMIDQAVKVGENYGVDYEVVVVDDGSEDNSAQIVSAWSDKDKRVKLIKHPRNLGYGAAVRTALKSATKDLVFFTDGDNQFRMADIEKLFSLIDSSDAVVGYRLNRRDAAYRRMNGKLWTGCVRLLFGLGVRDIDCAFKLFKRRQLEGLDFCSNHLTIHAEVLTKLRRKGCKISEIGITHYPRTAGKATATSLASVFKTLKELLLLYGRMR